MGGNVEWKDIQGIFNEVEDILNWPFSAALLFFYQFWRIVLAHSQYFMVSYLNFLQVRIGVKGSGISSAISDLFYFFNERWNEFQKDR